MDKNSVIITLLTIGGSAIVTIILGIVVPLLMTPQFAIEYDDMNRTGCTNLENWAYNETCPDEDGHIVIDIENIKLENTGLVQAKNVFLIINSHGEGNLKNMNCPEGTILSNEFSDIKKIEFSRFSKNLSCEFDLESHHSSKIKTVTVTADDTPGYQWTSIELTNQKIVPFIIIMIFFILALILALVFISYSAYVTIRDLILKKSLSIPSKFKAYSCDLKFGLSTTTESSSSENDPMKAQEDWIKNVQQLSTIPSTRGLTDDNIDKITFKIKNEEVNIKISSRQITLTTKKIRTLQKLLDIGNHPCWTFYYYLPNEFNVDEFVKKVKIKSGKTPTSSSSTKLKDGTDVITDADYHLLEADSGTIRTIFSKGTNETGGKIGIVHDGKSNMGFHRIKFVLTPRIIMLMTYGEISIEKSFKIIKSSCTPKSSWFKR